MVQIKLLFADSMKIVVSGLYHLFRDYKNFIVVGDAGCRNELIEKAYSLKPDMIICDFGLVYDDSCKTINHIRNVIPNVRFIAMTGVNERLVMQKAVFAGISGCIPKDGLPEEIIKAAELVSKGYSYICAMGTEDGSREQEGIIGKSFSNRVYNLTNREMEILALVAQNFSNKAISEALFISIPTVKTHISSILRKIGLSNRAQAIVFCLSKGIHFMPGQEPEHYYIRSSK